MKSVFEYKIEFGFSPSNQTLHHTEYAYNKTQALNKFKKKFPRATGIDITKGKQIRDERTARFLMTGSYKET